MERRIIISPKFLVLLGIILALIVGIAAWLNHKDNAVGDGAFIEVCLDGEKVAAYSINELMGFKSTTVHAQLQSAKSEDESGEYAGVMLSDLISKAGISDCKTIVLTAGDGYSSAAKGSEADEVLIAYEKDGAPLGYYETGGTGPIRAIFTEDTYGNRSIQYLTRINCKTK
ncbi:MAG: molybdopterin-dependent oxidoreductase [Clostridiales bacterium]|nr:molybdopterin-dependent oxidoreductase [Clostridiales bacterium]